MAQKYYNVKETANLLKVSESKVKEMLDSRELYGYRDGATWKFKAEVIEQLAEERKAAPAAQDASGSADAGDVLLSELELGASEPGLSGTVIGVRKGKPGSESDIRLADSDTTLVESALKLVDSDIKLGEESKPAAGRKDDVASKVSQFEELDLTLDQDLTLEASDVRAEARSKPDSGVDLSGKKLEDDDLVLGGSGAGSDITIGGDSGISLVDPADSGLSLEAPLNLAGSAEESLELGEDDLLAFSTDTGSGTGLKSEDDFQLTPMEEAADADDSESGSQVIALDTEGEASDAATMVGGGAAVAAMLDEEGEVALGLPGSGPMPGSGRLGLGSHADTLALGDQLAAGVAIPETPYTGVDIFILVLCSLLLILVGMMMYDVLRNMWSWDGVHSFNSVLMDTILGWFGK